MTSSVILALAVFGASAVEMVEALTIVLAAAVTRGWRSALEGTAAAVLLLAAIVAGVGVPLIHLVPINVLRVVIGGLLLVLGLNWLRKAILRASGHKALHDEDEIYKRTVAELSMVGAAAGGNSSSGTLAGTAGSSGGAFPDAGEADAEAAHGAPAARGAGRFSLSGPRDATGFVVAFKGVFLEGLEVVMIVLTLGSSSKHLGLAALAAAAAVVVVAAIGVVVSRQLSEVPENAMKMVVGVMLTSFGVFWVGEGSGVHWPGSDLFLLALIALFALTAALGIRLMRGMLPPPAGVRVPR